MNYDILKFNCILELKMDFSIGDALIENDKRVKRKHLLFLSISEINELVKI
ncbi:hypothetical protein KFK09_004113 [Dendrobium nobile]|uniref:Uncharacterized protein n=1 Tax=Dendrobium nobile TaxID=94219 RepID=A0A8T3BZN5_DENNO|nr:hypothetical protein KFK09_004113 [Dendrobium nobile]